MFKRFSTNDLFWLFCIFVFVALVMAMIPLGGIPDGKDVSQHLQFALTYYDSIKTGDFFPGWAASENYGFGSIGIRFYPPFAYYLLAMTRILTGNWYDAVWINFLCWMFVGCAGVYFWAKEWLSPMQSALTAGLYAIVPYHLAQIYQLMLIAEFAAAGVLPFCFLFATRLCQRNNWLDVVFFTVSYSLLILTHIPTTIIGSLALGIYVLLMIERTDFKKTFLQLGASFALSLALTAFHWVKLVGEMSLVKHSEPQYASGYYDFKIYLFPMLFNAGERYQTRLLWHFDISIILTFLLFLPLVIGLILKFRNPLGNNLERKVFLAFLATGFFALFLMSSPSTFVWNSVSVLQRVQFPWRWLSVFSLIAVMSFGIGLNYLFSSFNRIQKPLGYAVLAFLTVTILFNLTQTIIVSEPISRVKFEEKVAELKEDVGCRCWWTTWAESDAFNKKEKVFVKGRQVEISVWETEKREFIVDAGNEQNARVATFYYPHWKAEINGAAVKIQMDADGTILVPLQNEKSVVKLYFQEPFKVNLALAVSVIAWLLLLGAVPFKILLTHLLAPLLKVWNLLSKSRI